MREPVVSPREHEVLSALADRLTNAEIADRLFISVRTVENHVSALLRKLDAKNRRALAEIARQPRGAVDTEIRRLPATRGRLVGREEELAKVAAALETSRWVTIVGPAGVGKTRLALEAAGCFADDASVVFVDLTATRDDSTALSALLGAALVGDEPRSSWQAAFSRRFGTRSTLVVIDNCEHVVEVAADLAVGLMDVGPTLRVLATSREPFAVAAERVVLLTPLPIPNEGATTDSLYSNPSVELFIDRAAALGQDVVVDETTGPYLGSICRRLDGIPLALELAAAQLPALSPKQIDDRLSDRFALLRGPFGARSPRHATLETALAWSYDLLDVHERALMDRLAVFRGTFALEAVEEVATGPPIAAADVVVLLVRLVRKSLVVAEQVGADKRYRLLETMREFGWQRLTDAGELSQWRERHRQWIFGLMRAASEGLSCGVVPTWLDYLDVELDNIEVALGWSMSSPERAAEAMPVIRGLERYWMARGVRRAHGVRWSTAAAERATGLPVVARVEALLGATLLVMWSDLSAARALTDMAKRLAGPAGDPVAMGYAALADAWVHLFAGPTEDVARLAATAGDLIQEDDPVHPWAAVATATLHGYDGDHARAGSQIAEIGKAFLGNDDRHLYGAWLSWSADFLVAGGELASARMQLDASLREAQVADCASCESQALASLALLEDDAANRLRTGRSALRLARDIGEPWGVFCALEVVVGALAAGGWPEDAALLAGATRAARAQSGLVSILPGRAAALTDGEARALAELGTSAFDELARDGARLDLPSAVVHALG
ncbi:MAG: LuxR C-terminal-related transcriptional regulator [Mycobacteriales bacterium]